MRRIWMPSRHKLSLNWKFSYVKRLKPRPVADLLIVLLSLTLVSPSVTPAFGLPRGKHHHRILSPATGFSSVATAVTGMPCRPPTVSSELASLTDRLLLAANWVGNPEMGIDAIIQFGPQVVSHLNHGPWPNTNKQPQLVGDHLADQSKMLGTDRLGQSKLQYAIAQAWAGAKLHWGGGFDFTAPIKLTRVTVNRKPLILISGGRPITIHAKSRYQLPQILAGTEAVAAVDGGFFSLHFLNSNEMIGPVFSQSENRFIPGQRAENLKSTGRPLVLIGPQAVQFIPFNPVKHNTLAGVQAEMPNVTDAFVAAAWLVKDGQPRPANSFGHLVGFDAARNRAFWGINQEGKPMIGVSTDLVDSVSLGAALAKAGFRDAVMLDSGASTSLAYQGKSLVVKYEPRPVPHAVALIGTPVEGACSKPKVKELLN